MDLFDQDPVFAEADRAKEGVFDEQLSFGRGFVPAPDGLRRVLKRDGREEAFDKSKIALAIYRAAESIGGQDRDRASSLASGVSIYLSKKAGGERVTVDQINDAVEKVLMEMGHARTALAFARYRDKRERVRRLRRGDLRGLLSELEEAGIEEPPTPGADADRLVRTSDDRLATWDRERIVHALRKEAGMSEGLARVIALEVEGQIKAADVTTLTAALIRELVDAKLVERGLDAYRRRHMRLGVPLYDAERIICEPNHGAQEGPHDPVATDRAIARQVKREYALNEVLSREVADAHLRGEIHVHDLGLIDRFHSGAHTPAFVARFGAVRGANARYAQPPLRAEGLWMQMAQWHYLLCAHFAGSIRWDAFNVVAAPWVVNRDEAGLLEAAAHWHSAMAAAMPLGAPPATIALHWSVPGALANESAIGPGGESGDETYSVYGDASRAFMRSVLQYFGGHVQGYSPFVLRIHLDTACFERSGYLDMLHRAAACVAAGRTVEFVFDRKTGGRLQGPIWQPSEIAAHRVTLNLPRMAYRAGSEAGIAAEVERLVRLAVQSVNEKTRFLERLVGAKELGPYARVGFEYGGEAYMDMNRAVGFIGVTGLAECVQHLMGSVHDAEEARALGGRILSRIADRCAAYGEHACLKLQIVSTASHEEARRFASLDLHYESAKASAVVKTDALTQDVHYTPGIAWSGGSANLDRVAAEGAFHPFLQGDDPVIVGVREGQLAQEALAGFVQAAFYRTQARAIRFVPAARGAILSPV